MIESGVLRGFLGAGSSADGVGWNRIGSRKKVADVVVTVVDGTVVVGVVNVVIAS